MISTGQEISYDEVAAKLGELEAAIGKSDEEAVHILESAVPTYHHTKNCAEAHPMGPAVACSLLIRMVLPWAFAEERCAKPGGEKFAGRICAIAHARR